MTYTQNGLLMLVTPRPSTLISVPIFWVFWVCLVLCSSIKALPKYGLEFNIDLHGIQWGWVGNNTSGKGPDNRIGSHQFWNKAPPSAYRSATVRNKKQLCRKHFGMQLFSLQAPMFSTRLHERYAIGAQIDTLGHNDGHIVQSINQGNNRRSHGPNGNFDLHWKNEFVSGNVTISQRQFHLFVITINPRGLSKIKLVPIYFNSGDNSSTLTG